MWYALIPIIIKAADKMADEKTELIDKPRLLDVAPIHGQKN